MGLFHASVPSATDKRPEISEKDKSMKARGHILVKFSLLIAVLVVLGVVIFRRGLISQLPLFPHSPTSSGKTVSGFVTRSGSHLLLNGSPFRFAGANLHWLMLDDSTNYVSQFRINDGLDMAQEMGATVVRAHDVGISTGCKNCIEPSLAVFNQSALEHDDYVIKAAGEHGIRLVIPLTDNYHYPAGGKHNFTDWRGISDENQFYTNTMVIRDFETYI